DGWSVEQAAASGASAAKLLLPYHPDRALADAQRSVAERVLGSCRTVDLPLILEPLFYGVRSAEERERVVLTTVDDFASTGADLLKLPFPVDPAAVVEREDRIAACRRVTDRCSQPWALLSGGGDFESFAAQVDAALAGGASGFMVGRALWGDAARASAADRPRVIDEKVSARWRRLNEIARSERAIAALRDQEARRP
ncbi:MAG: DUF2090 domain-containing protein, partial [Ilumatobacter sp.]|nr:DUF2090 domain-containing protein [Ilumatobacter sp.]